MCQAAASLTPWHQEAAILSSEGCEKLSQTEQSSPPTQVQLKQVGTLQGFRVEKEPPSSSSCPPFGKGPGNAFGTKLVAFGVEPEQTSALGPPLLLKPSEGRQNPPHIPLPLQALRVPAAGVAFVVASASKQTPGKLQTVVRGLQNPSRGERSTCGQAGGAPPNQK